MYFESIVMVKRMLKQVGEQILDPSRDRFVSVICPKRQYDKGGNLSKKAMHSTDCTRGRCLEISRSRLGSFYLLIACISFIGQAKLEQGISKDWLQSQAAMEGEGAQ